MLGVMLNYLCRLGVKKEMMAAHWRELIIEEEELRALRPLNHGAYTFISEF